MSSDITCDARWVGESELGNASEHYGDDKLLRAFNIINYGIKDNREVSLWDIMTMAYDLGYDDCKAQTGRVKP